MKIRKELMYKRTILTLITLCLSGSLMYSQSLDSIKRSTSVVDSVINNPVVSYEHPITRVVAGLKVIGADDYDNYVLKSLSGISVGDQIQIPGPALTSAVNRYMQYGFFSNARVIVEKYKGNKVWLEIQLVERPRINGVTYNGISNSDKEDLQNRLGLRSGMQLSPNIIDRTKQLIKKYYDGKGYRDMTMKIEETPVAGKKNYVNLTINIDKSNVIKIDNIYFKGNTALSDYALRMAMKNTNEGFSLSRGRWLSSLLKIFSTKKFVDKDFHQDLQSIIDKYHEKGYRDAEITLDSVAMLPDHKHVNIYIDINEGPKYYIDGIRFVGNTKYNSELLERVLGIKKGDLYDQKKLSDRLMKDDDAITNLYYNNGYIFTQVDPVETKVVGDSINLDIRINEGPQATINRVIIKGNTLVYDNVIRRELYTKPGALFSREDLKNSFTVINQLGYFDAEKSVPKPIPNPQDGTVDIEYDVVEKSSDQFNISFGWSESGLIGNVGLTFNNFSINNLFNPSMYKGFLPQGDGQRLSISAQSNAKFYNQVSLSFSDPWFGGRRPNLLSVSASYSRMTAIDQRFYNNQRNQLLQSGLYDPYGYGYGGYPGYGGYGGYGYGGYPGYSGVGGGYSLTNKAYDSDRSLSILSLSLGNGRRLSWPDNWFRVSTSLNYNRYFLRNWTYGTFGSFHNGSANDVNVELNIERNSMDNPIYTRSGSDFLLSVKATPPYSLFSKTDYSNPNLSSKERYQWIEYYKWKFKSRMFMPLMNPITTKRTPVLMTRFEGGILGSYNKYKKSPFGRFYVGGDMLSAAYSNYLNETIGLRGYDSGAIAGYNFDYANSYFKVSAELRYPIIFEQQATIWALAFVEAGNAWVNNTDYDPFNLKRSAGVGVRVYIPYIGLIGLDWAYGFDRGNNGVLGGSHIHFVLGQDL